ncbi:hypothetical protein F511_22546 [Dorcoceras hygrometricum]|uniref:Uncharacterized protein n=1 Tax=Dorcoceras hygrometricum TaxID=472368 RepID=A0A2Z7C554_9LAMI|nr:hypothetical protein F511_22546 [Dorcoceras hygrometricum]
MRSCERAITKRRRVGVPLKTPITRTHRSARKYLDLAFIKRRRTTHTLPTPNLIYAKRHRITYTQPAHIRAILNDIVSLPSQGNSLKHTRKRSGHPDLT